MKSIRFIHAADLHLDSPFKGLSHFPSDLFHHIQESTFVAFSRVVDAALEYRVDFLLLAGDLFDGEDRSIKAQARLNKELERLGDSGIPVFAVHGNHDHLSGEFLELKMPDHVHIFGTEVECIEFRTKSGADVHIYGFSYPERHVYEKQINKYVKKEGADFHIALLHGQWEDGGGSHQPYAPFSVRDLLQKGMDYWALGHIHQQSILHEDPLIVYPGNIQGRHANEQGEKGCLLVELADDGKQVMDMIPASSIIWDTLAVECQEGFDLGALYSSCLQRIEDKRAAYGKNHLLEIKLQHTERLEKNLRRKLENGEFLELLQADQATEDPFLWPYKIVTEYTAGVSEWEKTAFAAALGETAGRIVGEGRLGEAFQELYSHPFASRYLEPVHEEEEAALFESAKNLIAARLNER